MKVKVTGKGILEVKSVRGIGLGATEFDMRAKPRNVGS
jgi:hypothetical protein